MKKLATLGLAAALALSLSGCGERVEVPPAHLGKIMTKDGYMEGTIGTSKFRLPACVSYCDKLVLLNVADQAYLEKMEIFMPEDKLKLKISVRINLTLSPKKAESIFNSLPPSTTEENNDQLSSIGRDVAYNTYASQIVQTETREYLSQYTIAEVASNLEKVNADLRARLSKSLSTHFDVRYVGITNIEYPAIISEAQENAARRREQIEQENAQLAVSKVQLERQLQEAQLQRRIDVEKAEADAEADRVRAVAASNPAVITLRKLEIDKIKAEKWNGQLPRVSGQGNELLIDLRD